MTKIKPYIYIYDYSILRRLQFIILLSVAMIYTQMCGQCFIHIGTSLNLGHGRNDLSVP